MWYEHVQSRSSDFVIGWDKLIWINGVRIGRRPKKTLFRAKWQEKIQVIGNKGCLFAWAVTKQAGTYRFGHEPVHGPPLFLAIHSNPFKLLGLAFTSPHHPKESVFGLILLPIAASCLHPPLPPLPPSYPFSSSSFLFLILLVPSLLPPPPLLPSTSSTTSSFSFLFVTPVHTGTDQYVPVWSGHRDGPVPEIAIPGWDITSYYCCCCCSSCTVLSWIGWHLTFRISTL